MKLPLTCECGRPFETSKNCPTVNLEAARRGGFTKLFFECRFCGRWVEFNPVINKPVKAKPKRTAAPYRCPVAGCSGWVSRVTDDDKPFWGCGECGAVWFKTASFLKEIDGIIRRYPYRKSCYRKVAGKWKPQAADKEPRGYDRKVEREEPDDSEDYVRG